MLLCLEAETRKSSKGQGVHYIESWHAEHWCGDTACRQQFGWAGRYCCTEGRCWHSFVGLQLVWRWLLSLLCASQLGRKSQSSHLTPLPRRLCFSIHELWGLGNWILLAFSTPLIPVTSETVFCHAVHSLCTSFIWLGTGDAIFRFILHIHYSDDRAWETRQLERNSYKLADFMIFMCYPLALTSLTCSWLAEIYFTHSSQSNHLNL